jgi:hypothetical protein
MVFHGTYLQVLLYTIYVKFQFPFPWKAFNLQIGSPLKSIVTFFIVAFFLLQDPLVSASFMNYSSLAWDISRAGKIHDSFDIILKFIYLLVFLL